MATHKEDVEMSKRIAHLVSLKGGSAYFVGGYVRDFLQGKINKDIDIEIHGLTHTQLEKIIDSLGERITVGKNFGVYGLKGYSIDVSMPRKEKNMGSGHKDFDICIDPFIGTYKAALRRDFTINAIMQNIITGEFIDAFDGRKDLQNGIIRHVNTDTFLEDPLRVFRAAQFASRFSFSVAPKTTGLCKKINLHDLSKERVMGELQKALLKSKKPSVFFETLKEMDQLTTWFPELESLIGVKQNPKYHAEKDTWTHTMMVLDEAVNFVDRVTSPLGFLLSAITHDFGKAICTKAVNGKLLAYKHDIKGQPLVDTFMHRLTTEKNLILYVLNLSLHHMKPNMLASDKASIKATNKMFDKAIDPEALICLAISDALGRISLREHISYNDDFLYKRLAIFKEYMSRPYVMGRDLVKAGLHPCAKFKDYLAYAHKLRLAGVCKESALRQTLSYARKVNS